MTGTTELFQALDRMGASFKKAEADLKEMGFGVVQEFAPAHYKLFWQDGRIYGTESERPILECKVGERMEAIKDLALFLVQCRMHANHLADQIMAACEANAESAQEIVQKINEFSEGKINVIEETKT